MKPLNRLLLIFLFMAQFFCSQNVWAAEHLGFKEEFIWQLVSFVLLIILLSYALKKPIKNFLTKRQKDIKDYLENAAFKEREAQGISEEWAKKLSSLGHEIAELHQKIAQEGEAERQKIIERARKEGERIRKQARLIAEQEMKKARLALKKETADLSLELAENIVKNNIQPEDQERLVNDFLGKIREIR